MTVLFRNLDFNPTAPIDSWPAEAIETIIDRGSLSDWHRLADAIRRNPWGPPHAQLKSWPPGASTMASTC